MAKGITKTQLVRLLAEKSELSNKQTASFLELLADTAIKETKKSGEFTIPGIGKLVKAERKARLGQMCIRDRPTIAYGRGAASSTQSAKSNPAAINPGVDCSASCGPSVGSSVSIVVR